MKFANRKFAEQGLYKGKNLKNKSPYESQTYINNSLCPEFKFLNFCVRKAKKAKQIHFYKVRHGITSVQMVENGDFHEISHKADLVRLNIMLPTDEEAH